MSILSRADNFKRLDFSEISLLSFIYYIPKKIEKAIVEFLNNSLDFISIRLFRRTPVNH